MAVTLPNIAGTSSNMSGGLYCNQQVSQPVMNQPLLDIAHLVSMNAFSSNHNALPELSNIPIGLNVDRILSVNQSQPHSNPTLNQYTHPVQRNHLDLASLHGGHGVVSPMDSAQQVFMQSA